MGGGGPSGGVVVGLGMLRRAGMAGPSVDMPLGDVTPELAPLVVLSGVDACLASAGRVGMTGACAGVGTRGAGSDVGAGAGEVGVLFAGVGAGREGTPGTLTSCTYHTVERVVGGM